MTKKALLHNIIVTVLLLALATIGSSFFQHVSHNTTNIAMIYMLAVLLTARFTEGYVPGIIASVIGTIFINYIFTYPYMALNFTLEGYPVTFTVMMMISGITSTLITHTKEQNRIINEREKLLMEAEKEKMRANLLRAISHDLRTPLTSIIGTSSAFLDHGNDIPIQEKEAFQSIYDDSNWLLNMVENLLSVTRIRDDNRPVNKTSEPLEEVVSESIIRFKKRIPSAQVHASIPDDFIMIPMDATLIEQVIINLLENAVYHSDSTEPISLKVLIENGYAWFHVIDYGKGIPPELLSTIFDGHSSTPNNSGDSRKGMGIGLSICKTIILAHGGKITAKNHECGACFSFSLPLGENNEA